MLWLIPLAVCISFRLYMCGRPHWSCLSAHGLEKSWNFSLQMKGGIEYSAGPGRTLLLWPLIGRDSLSKDWNELHWHEHAFYCLSSLLRVLPVKPKELCYSVFFFKLPPTFFFSLLTHGFQTDLSDLFYKSYGSRGGFAPSHLSPLSLSLPPGPLHLSPLLYSLPGLSKSHSCRRGGPLCTATCQTHRHVDK